MYQVLILIGIASQSLSLNTDWSTPSTLFARGVFQALKSRALQRATDPQVNAKASQSPLGKGSQGRTSMVILWTQKFYVGNNCCVSMYQYVRM